MLVARVDEDQGHEYGEGHQRIEPLVQALAQQAHGPRAQRIARQDHMGQGKQNPERDDDANRGHGVMVPARRSSWRRRAAHSRPKDTDGAN